MGWIRTNAILTLLKRMMDDWAKFCGTVATALHELGFGMEVVEKLLNHVGVSGSDVAGIYNKAEHLPERKRALDLWGAKVDALVMNKPIGAKVISFQSR